MCELHRVQKYCTFVIMTARRLGCAGYLARIWGDRYTYKILIWKCFGKCAFERFMKLGHKFVMDVGVTGCNDWR